MPKGTDSNSSSYADARGHAELCVAARPLTPTTFEIRNRLQVSPRLTPRRSATSTMARLRNGHGQRVVRRTCEKSRKVYDHLTTEFRLQVRACAIWRSRTSSRSDKSANLVGRGRHVRPSQRPATWANCRCGRKQRGDDGLVIDGAAAPRWLSGSALVTVSDPNGPDL